MIPRSQNSLGIGGIRPAAERDRETLRCAGRRCDAPGRPREGRGEGWAVVTPSRRAGVASRAEGVRDGYDGLSQANEAQVLNALHHRAGARAPAVCGFQRRLSNGAWPAMSRGGQRWGGRRGDWKAWEKGPSLHFSLLS